MFEKITNDDLRDDMICYWHWQHPEWCNQCENEVCQFDIPRIVEKYNELLERRKELKYVMENYKKLVVKEPPKKKDLMIVEQDIYNIYDKYIKYII